MEDKEESSMVIAIPLSLKAMVPFLQIQKRMGSLVDLQAAKHTVAAEREAPVVEKTPKNPKRKRKYVSPTKPKHKLEVPSLEGVPRIRRLVLKSTMPTKKANVKSFSESAI